jgi:DNA helicase-2/ATP-dependent DNA helicase PcrA
MFYADLHVHSRFSRATSRDCDLEHLALWAARKGIAVLGTGDFTHPGWFAELQEQLVPAEPGLFRFRGGDCPNSRGHHAQHGRENGTVPLDATKGTVPFSLGRKLGQSPLAPRFLLQTEISTIYKKAGRTRKVHHLVYVPDFTAARRLNDRLGRIGNLASDGRPILGLDSRNLLEIVLSAGEGSYLVPAHIWTPWFAVLGSKSGFDAIDECYGDLAGEVFALETGLSSDPAMNRLVSALDRFTLVSNSDAHSPAKLGREATAFDAPLDYFAMRRALQTGAGYGGTIEFFPEEGKYHLDGHRKCGVCLTPAETRQCGGLCPQCGKPLTLGVLYRVCELADRPFVVQASRLPGQPERLHQKRAAPFRSLIPLAEVLAEVLGVGLQSKKVRQQYDELLARVGPELFILERAPLEDVAHAGSSRLAEALRRMRAGRVLRTAGYDGQYGAIRLFAEGEK